VRFTTLQEWLAWQETLHPSEIELGLERVDEVWRQLNPERLSSIVITIAGTNGKGSSAAILESILLAAGHAVGCYTSPHLLKYNERIRINGRPASDKTICDAFNRVDQARQDSSLTYFEFGTLAALDIFAGEQLDVVILEVGLGGRLDAVNIIDPDVALITTIDIDHTDWLGNTRDEIALEKAGIMRSGSPAVFGSTNPPQALLERATGLGVDLYIAGEDFSYSRLDSGWSWKGKQISYEQLPEPVAMGEFVLQNCSAVLMVLELLRKKIEISDRYIESGILGLIIPGRFQVINGEVTVVLDVAHNPEAAAQLAANLNKLSPEGRNLAVFSALKDKDIVRVVEPMADLVDQWHIGELEINRAAALDQLQNSLVSAGVEASNIHSYKSLSQAYTKAMADAVTHDKIIVFGSFFTVAEVMKQSESIKLA
jgi:dihydrofolate synthase/folylpolyglutamate synthase